MSAAISGMVGSDRLISTDIALTSKTWHHVDIGKLMSADIMTAISFWYQFNRVGLISGRWYLTDISFIMSCGSRFYDIFLDLMYSRCRSDVVTVISFDRYKKDIMLISFTDITYLIGWYRPTRDRPISVWWHHSDIKKLISPDIGFLTLFRHHKWYQLISSDIAPISGSWQGTGHPKKQ